MDSTFYVTSSKNPHADEFMTAYLNYKYISKKCGYFTLL